MSGRTWRGEGRRRRAGSGPGDRGAITAPVADADDGEAGGEAPDSRLSRVGGHARAASLLLVAALLPFETTAGALRISGLTVTVLEAALLMCGIVEIALRLGQGAVALHAVMAGRPAVGNAPRDWGVPGRWPVFAGLLSLFVGAAALSALVAPTLAEGTALNHTGYNTVALKGAARLLVDALVGLSAAALVARPPAWCSARRLLAVVVAAAAVAAALGVAEQQLLDGADVEPILRLFRDKATLAGSVRRLTGPFAQANISADFFALALPLSLALAWPDGATEPPHRRLRWSLTAMLLTWALLGTYSRGALLATLAGALMVGLWARQHASQRRAGLAWWLIGLVGAGLLLRLAVDPAQRNRLGLPPQGHPLRWSVRLGEGGPTSVAATSRQRLHLRNEGWLTWRANGTDPMRVLGTARDDAGQVVAESRTRLPRRVPAGGTITLDASLPLIGGLPASAAMAITSIRWRLEQHGLGSVDASPVAIQAWRVSLGRRLLAATLSLDTRVGDDPAMDDAGPAAPATRADLWPAALRRWWARPWLGWGADTFRLRWPEDLPTLRADRRMHANSLWLELLADVGLLGCLSFAGALCWAVARGGGGGPLRVGAAIAVATWAIHGGVDCLLYFHGPAALCWMCAGVAATSTD